MAAALACSVSPSVRGDAVTDWNAIAVQYLTTATPPRPGVVWFLDLAMVQAAVHDAAQAIEGRFEPYHVEIPDASGSPVAAAVTAAHDVLVGILPSQSGALGVIYQAYLVAHGLAPNDPGVAVGQAAAAGILTLRAADGRVPVPLPPPYNGGLDPGDWRPTESFQPGGPPSFASMATPWLGNVPTFSVKSGQQFRPIGPPPLKSKRYAEAYNEVKALGARYNSARSSEQTALAYFYGGNLAVQFHDILRNIASTLVDDLGDRARLLALANLAIADSVITAWDCKLHFNFWRPLTAIREGNNDGNPATAGDPTWEPLLNNPPYPDYTSGANNVAGALTCTLALFFGTDHMTFAVTSAHPMANPPLRIYTRFSDLAKDIVDVRIYQGLHFRFADTEARKQGRHIAQWTFAHYLRPLDIHEDDHEEDDDDHED